MPIDTPSTVPPSTIRTDEVERFNSLAATWWDSTGPMRPRHVMNGLRLGNVLEQITEHQLKQADAAQILIVSRPRVSDVVNQQTAKFTIDSLVEMVSRAGKPVRLAAG